MKRVGWTAVLALVAAPVAADVVMLRGGGEIRGEVLERRAGTVVIQVGPGRLTLPLSRVDFIVDDTADIEIYRHRASALAAGDVAGWLALARWARGRELLTLSREAFERVLAYDPENAAAHDALGHVPLGGRWVSLEDAQRARGLVEFEGRWVSPRERDAELASRALEAQGRLASREADARAREAEARARAAEADARRAEADAQQRATEARSGVPYPWVYGPGAVVVPPVLGPGGVIVRPFGSPFPHHRRPQPPVSVTVQIPAPPPPAPAPPPVTTPPPTGAFAEKR